MSIDYQNYFEIEGGVLRLNSNVNVSELPEVLVLPDKIGETEVTSLTPGMFEGNNRVKEITLPTTVQAIPNYFCANATNLRAINGTEHITSIGEGAFGCTRIKNAIFPDLETLNEYAFTGCGYLENVDIGTVSAIPAKVFRDCVHLRNVICEGNEVSIGEQAFANTWSLRELPLLAHVSQVADGAFYSSSIRTSLSAGGLIGTKAFPAFDNTTDFWTGVTFIPCRNRIVTKLSQNNAEWAEKTFLLDGQGDTTSRKYNKGCALFAVMHIHSAITGKYYAHPDEFVEELKNNGKSEFLVYDNWPGQFDNVAPMLGALGYRTEVYGTDSNLSQEDYKALVDALAQGAYIYAQVGTYNNTNDGHAVVIYGINDLGEVCVLDSDVLHEHFRADGFEQGTDVYTYTIPYQNIVGPSSNFVIVYPTDAGTADAVTPACPPHRLPTGVNVSMVSTASEWEKLPEEKEGVLTAYHLFSSPANAVEEWQPNESSNKYVRYAKNPVEWYDWYMVAPASYTPSENAD